MHVKQILFEYVEHSYEICETDYFFKCQTEMWEIEICFSLWNSERIEIVSLWNSNEDMTEIQTSFKCAEDWSCFIGLVVRNSNI